MAWILFKKLFYNCFYLYFMVRLMFTAIPFSEFSWSTISVHNAFTALSICRKHAYGRKIPTLTSALTLTCFSSDPLSNSHVDNNTPLDIRSFAISLSNSTKLSLASISTGQIQIQIFHSISTTCSTNSLAANISHEFDLADRQGNQRSVSFSPSRWIASSR